MRVRRGVEASPRTCAATRLGCGRRWSVPPSVWGGLRLEVQAWEEGVEAALPSGLVQLSYELEGAAQVRDPRG